ncbi:Fur family transcriptional regulator [Clostridium cochlearium]|jgi:Fe2+ or Zn2+ uptake regulation protein|uniref:Fe2+ or Zn2+ uptake regulation protein n=1 Tax=Clostridium cochlearium TaxID=1494 RepID=A0A239ZC05_CLOCO|nr:Fur family transcriptional regulator [Clostridium cochlearium]MBU5269901.1 transcriptional repressor [Clostridium cochlearium]MCG4571371.1 transcriptional repressor [Clostridium cochlearium]MCR1972399.1 transcriptional repressor [Clostridium cochlearium]NME96219.1 transcriptional repressor [Clostridium cochlearium]SDL34694.1 Fe2+ or Zn2+ uptake regulation protein [Clostridium cochlearium]
MNIEKFLKENKLRVTKGRINILEVLSCNKDAITAEYIYHKLKERDINIDLSTVYRNLEIFNKEGIIDKFDVGDGKYNYLINPYKHKHILECAVCHKEIEIDCPIKQLEQIIKNRTGFTIEEELDIKIKGLCEECSEK